jgi:hypothetical protein
VKRIIWQGKSNKGTHDRACRYWPGEVCVGACNRANRRSA